MNFKYYNINKVERGIKRYTHVIGYREIVYLCV